MNINDLTITNLEDAKNVLNSMESIGDNETNSKMKFDLSTGGLFSNHYSNNSTNDSDGVDYMNKINSRKRDSSRLGQGDGSPVVGRVPKSATFHNSKEKEAKAKSMPRGSVIQEQVCVYFFLFHLWYPKVRGHCRRKPHGSSEKGISFTKIKKNCFHIKKDISTLIQRDRKNMKTFS